MQKKWYCALMNAIAFFLFSGEVLALTAPKPYVAVGYHTTTDYQVNPLIAVNVGGKQWSYPQLPVSQSLKNVNCNEHFCVIDGWLNHTPALSVSIDQGKSWSSIKPLMQSSNGGSQNISCNEQACFIVGYQDLQDKNIPVVAVSKTGLDWRYHKISVPDLPQDYFVNVHSIACGDKNCVALGGYRKQENDYEHNSPFVAVSQDQGMTWTFPLRGDSSKLYHDYLSLYCDDNLCLISEKDSSGFIRILMSKDSGLSWHETSVTFPEEIRQKTSKMTIHDIHCSDSWCVAAGMLYNKSRLYISPYPAVIISQDKGEHWVYPSALISLLPHDVKESFFYHTHCHKDLCMIAGGFIPEGACVTTPAVITSVDRGKTWEYQPITSPNTSIKNFKKCDDNGLINISCNENHCIVAGRDQDVPLLAVTEDKGKTWAYPFDKTVLPKNFSHGGFEKGTR